MSTHSIPPRRPKPEPTQPAVEILGWFYNVLMATVMLIISVVTCFIILFGITVAALFIAQFIVAISNPIPFIEQF